MVNCLTKWVYEWIEKNWIDVKNRDVIEECYNLMQERIVKFKNSENDEFSKDASKLSLMGSKMEMDSDPVQI